MTADALHQLVDRWRVKASGITNLPEREGRAKAFNECAADLEAVLATVREEPQTPLKLCAGGTHTWTRTTSRWPGPAERCDCGARTWGVQQAEGRAPEPPKESTVPDGRESAAALPPNKPPMRQAEGSGSNFAAQVPQEPPAVTFQAFSVVNRQRCESPQGFNHALASWNTSDWFLAVLGELGEAANVAKKLNRVRDGIPGNKETPNELREKLRKEIGDAFVYLDLLAQAHDFSVLDAAIEVFNAKSEEIGCPIRCEAHEARAAQPLDWQPIATACAWELDEDDGSYDTECGQKFVFIDGGGPRENQMRFCCYCGGKLVVPHADRGSSASE